MGGSVSTSQVRTDGVVEVERGLQIVDGKELLNERKATANRYLKKVCLHSETKQTK
jgi:hypothetical protein